MLCVVLCSEYQRELEAIGARQNDHDVTYRTFDPPCRQPVMNQESLERTLQDLIPAEMSAIYVLAGRCLQNMPLTRRAGIALRMCAYNPCASMIADSDVIAGYHQQGAYVLTPGNSRTGTHVYPNGTISQNRHGPILVAIPPSSSC
ncbi:MAG: hypothetical protein HC837_02040 [Chloroflexaceae bacterium]|nr:hypothetical protein [Chloroflexaceae bacterium]